MEARISLITLGVADLARSIRFYRDGLSLPLREPADEIAFFEMYLFDLIKISYAGEEFWKGTQVVAIISARLNLPHFELHPIIR